MDDDRERDDDPSRATGTHIGAQDPGSGSNDRLPAMPDPDDDTPVGDTDQHSEVPSDADDDD